MNNLPYQCETCGNEHTDTLHICNPCRINRMKKLALDNYNNGGDIMVECWDTWEYEEFIANYGDQAEVMFHKMMSINLERRRSIENTAF